MSAAGQATRPVLELDGWSWRRATPGDAAVLEALASAGENRRLFGLPPSEADFAAAIGRPGLRVAMVCTHGAEPVGGAAINRRNSRSQNAQLLPFFARPERAATPLATYVRHLFWLLPMHRLYVQLPLLTGASTYVELFEAVAFRDEGVVKEYVVIEGQAYDVAVLGLLRDEFETWCRENETRLNL